MSSGRDIALQAPQEFTTLVLAQGTPPAKPSTRKECDSRKALTRGVKEYLETLSYDDWGGRKLQFRTVLDDYGEVEHSADFPSAVVYTLDEAIYEARSLSPTLDPRCVIPGTNDYVVAVCDYVQDLVVEVWCTDPLERDGFSAMLEDAFNPVIWRYGFYLDLPHYLNMRGDFSLKSKFYEDDDASASRRIRKARFTLSARVPLARVFRGLPGAKPQFTVADGDPQAERSGKKVIFEVQP